MELYYWMVLVLSWPKRAGQNCSTQYHCHVAICSVPEQAHHGSNNIYSAVIKRMAVSTITLKGHCFFAIDLYSIIANKQSL